MNYPKSVLICGAAFVNIILSSLELGKCEKEVLGDLIGSREKKGLVKITNARVCPQTESDWEGTTYKNGFAKNLEIEFDRIITECGRHGSSIIGGYHSHIFYPTEQSSFRLSNPQDNPKENDIKFIEREMRKQNLLEWIEILNNIELNTKTFKEDRYLVYKIAPESKRLKINLCSKRLHTEANITIQAFYLCRELMPKYLSGKLKAKELPIKYSKRIHYIHKKL